MRRLTWGMQIVFILSMMVMLFTPSFANEEDETQQVPMEEVQRFSNAMGLIKKYYVKPVDDKVLFENAIRGMLSGLDPHSAYLDEAEYTELQTATSGEFGGLGIEVSMEDDVIKVITPLVDTPAYNAGIKSGDYIIKIGPQAVQGMKLKDAVDLMRGQIGSKVNLTIVRKGGDKPKVYHLTREKIIIKSVKSRILDNNYGYVRLTQFQALTPEEMKKAILALKKQAGGELKGLILDLRNNPGGLLDAAIQVSDAFLDKTKQSAKPELIVYTEGRFPGSEFKAIANPGDILNKAPLVVLINHGSASASEIVAGALKDNKRAIVVGTQSFGKGSVQTVLPVDDKRAIKLTTALYYTPSGVSIQAKGITPDIVIEEMKIPKDTNNDALEFSEASLNGHLANKADLKKTKGAIATKKVEDEDALMHEDYQLYSALTILRGIAVAGH
ncbi:MAG: peptidase S41 [Legionellales bacterium RIFCSPHIGHO2_12_FULL_37_14]|nr:MAG: peptidase S41 [Legionellales bacterium RIFCSPHIGHO2_12_FULL_37_14]